MDGGVKTKLTAGSHWYVILWVVFSSSYPLLPVSAAAAVWPVSAWWRDGIFWKGVRGRGGSRAGLNLHRLTVDWCFCQRIVTSCSRLNPWTLRQTGPFKGSVAKSSWEKIFYLKTQMIIPLSVLRAFLNPCICVIWYYNARWRGIFSKFSF